MPGPRTLAWKSNRIVEPYWFGGIVSDSYQEIAARPSGACAPVMPPTVPFESVVGGPKGVTPAFAVCVCSSLPSCW